MTAAGGLQQAHVLLIMLLQMLSSTHRQSVLAVEYDHLQVSKNDNICLPHLCSRGGAAAAAPAPVALRQTVVVTAAAAG